MSETLLQKPTLIYFGSSKFSERILRTVAPHFLIPLIITQPDKPVGRDKTFKETAVSETAKELGIPTVKPERLKGNAEILTQIKDLSPDLFLVMAYGQIIPEELINLPKFGAINIHPSLLPKYRGASPIAAPLLAGDVQTGISIMLMDKKMDHGPIIAQFLEPISFDETYPELEEKLTTCAESVIVKVLNDHIQGKTSPQEQEHINATHAGIITKENGKIDWGKKSIEIYNQYRAYAKWPGIWTTWDGKILKIKKCAPAEMLPDSTFVPGIVFEKDGKVFTNCGAKSVLQILEVQLEGKNPADIQDFVRGHKNFIGARLGA